MYAKICKHMQIYANIYACAMATVHVSGPTGLMFHDGWGVHPPASPPSPPQKFRWRGACKTDNCQGCYGRISGYDKMRCYVYSDTSKSRQLCLPQECPFILLAPLRVTLRSTMLFIMAESLRWLLSCCLGGSVRTNALRTRKPRIASIS